MLLGVDTVMSKVNAGRLSGLNTALVLSLMVLEKVKVLLGTPLSRSHVDSFEDLMVRRNTWLWNVGNFEGVRSRLVFSVS